MEKRHFKDEYKFCLGGRAEPAEDFIVCGVTHCSTVDGPGLRTVVWFQGCKNHCKGCQNPNSWETDMRILCNTEYGKYVRGFSVSALYNEVIPNKLEDGLTLSGGDPLWQHDLYKLADFIHQYHHLNPQKNIWMYTGLKYGNLKKHVRDWVDHNDDIEQEIKKEYSGWLYDYLFGYVDVLVDGPFVEKLKTDKCIYRGSSNQRLINMKESVRLNRLVLFDPNNIQI